MKTFHAEGAFFDAARSFDVAHDVAMVCTALHDAGLTAVSVPAFGKSVDVVGLCAARDALAYHSAMADSVLAVLGLGCFPVAQAGTEAQWNHFVAPVRGGQVACGFALTEPDAGSDVASLATRAEPDGPAWRLSGRKTFISNAPIAAWFTVFAQTAQGPAAFVVEADDPGVRILSDVPMTGDHPIGSIELHEARIPAGRLLGAPGQGIKIALATLDTYRVSVAAAACGMAARALDESMMRVTSRRQFGKPLAEFQLTQARLAESATALYAARGLVTQAATAVARADSDAKLRVSMAKLFATEQAQVIIDGAVQLHGGLGVMRGVKVEELYRDVRALRIYEGTSEIQKLIIARELLRPSSS